MERMADQQQRTADVLNNHLQALYENEKLLLVHAEETKKYVLDLASRKKK
jgi:hypothetical protein